MWNEEVIPFQEIFLCYIVWHDSNVPWKGCFCFMPVSWAFHSQAKVWTLLEVTRHFLAWHFWYPLKATKAKYNFKLHLSYKRHFLNRKYTILNPFKILHYSVITGQEWCNRGKHLKHCHHCVCIQVIRPNRTRDPLESPTRVFLGQWPPIAQTRFCDVIEKSPQSGCRIATASYLFLLVFVRNLR